MITIVIPAYNAEKFLSATLESVAKQTIEDWEAIIVDDGSTDDTRTIAAAFAHRDPRFRLIAQQNAGPSAARNHGARSANPHATEIIFLDGDDLWEPDALAVLRHSLASRPDVIAAYGLASSADSAGRLVDIGAYEDHQRRRFAVCGDKVAPVPPDAPTTFACEIVTELIVTCGTVLIRREAFEQTSGWSEDIRLWEDWEFWLRLTQVGDFLFVDRPILRKRCHGSNLSADWSRVEAGERAVRARLLSSLSEKPELLRAARLGSKFHHQRIIEDKLAWIRRAVSSGDLLSAVKQLRHIIRLQLLGPVR